MARKHVPASTNNSHVRLRSRLAALPPCRAARTKRMPIQVSWTVPLDRSVRFPARALFSTGRSPQNAALPWPFMDAVGTTISSSQAPTSQSAIQRPQARHRPARLPPPMFVVCGLERVDGGGPSIFCVRAPSAAASEAYALTLPPRHPKVPTANKTFSVLPAPLCFTPPYIHDVHERVIAPSQESPTIQIHAHVLTAHVEQTPSGFAHEAWNAPRDAFGVRRRMCVSGEHAHASYVGRERPSFPVARTAPSVPPRLRTLALPCRVRALWSPVAPASRLANFLPSSMGPYGTRTLDMRHQGRAQWLHGRRAGGRGSHIAKLRGHAPHPPPRKAVRLPFSCSYSRVQRALRRPRAPSSGAHGR